MHMESDDFNGGAYKTVAVGNLSGDSIQVIVRMRNGDVDEHHFIDNIEIHRSDTLFSIGSANWNNNPNPQIWSLTRTGGSCGCTPNS